MLADTIAASLFFFNDTATTEIYTLSLHDALPISNGLGGNWLLEALVFGERAGLAAAQKEPRSAKGIEGQLEDERRRITALGERPARSERAGAIRSELGRLMRRHVGPLRDASGLKEAGNKISELSARYRRVGIMNKGQRYNYELA